MGSPPSDTVLEVDTAPVHRVVFAMDFAVGVFAVSRAQFGRFVAATHYVASDECRDYASGEWRPRKAECAVPEHVKRRA
jgi:formylglycine-generating enzyme required for sulfatase activity